MSNSMVKMKNRNVHDQSTMFKIRESFDSELSRNSDAYAYSEMSDDMHQILSPSFDNGGSTTHLVQDPICSAYQERIESSCSTDSIIRRVEEEIAAARKASSTVSTTVNETSSDSSHDSLQHLKNGEAAEKRLSFTKSFRNTNREINEKRLSIDAPASGSDDHFVEVATIFEKRSIALPSPKIGLRSQSPKERPKETIEPVLLHLSQSPPNSVDGAQSTKASSKNCSSNNPVLWQNDRVGDIGNTKNRIYQQHADEFLTSSNSDADMQDILGVDDDDDEKKTNIEPSSPSRLVKQRVFDLCNPNDVSTFDKIDYLRKKVGSSDSMDHSRHGTDAQIHSVPNNREQVHINHDNRFEDTPVVTDNANFVYDGNEFYPDINAIYSKSNEKTSRKATASGSALVLESIYFTDEEWQVDIVNKVSIDGSMPRSTKSSSRILLSNDIKEKKIIEDTTLHQPTHPAAGNRLNSADSQKEDDFPLLQKSSTEDATVSVQHHPVFQKRTSLADSVSAFDSAYKDIHTDLIDGKTKHAADKDRLPYKSDDFADRKDSLKLRGSVENPDCVESCLEVVSFDERKTIDFGVALHESTNALHFAAQNDHDMQNPNPAVNSIGLQLLVDGKNAKPQNSATTLNPGPIGNFTRTDIKIDHFHKNEQADYHRCIEPEKVTADGNDTSKTSAFCEDSCDYDHSSCNAEGIQKVPSSAALTTTCSTGSGVSTNRRIPYENLALSNCDTGNEWDKMNDLLVKLKEQRDVFSTKSGKVPNIDNMSSFSSPSNTYEDIAACEAENRNDLKPFLAKDSRDKVFQSSSRDGESLVNSDYSTTERPTIGSNPGHRSPRYFNFMRVKRAKQRARKLQTTNLPIGPDTENFESNEGSLNISESSNAFDTIFGCNDTNREDTSLQTNIFLRPEANGLETSSSAGGKLRLDECSLDTTMPVNVNHMDSPVGGPQPMLCHSPERLSPIERANRNRRVCSPKAENLGNDKDDSPRSGVSTAFQRLELVKSETEEATTKYSTRIRFRNPFPIVKPVSKIRDPSAIVKDNTTEIPDVPIRWAKPNKELKQLIVAAMGTSLARRSNACGALKVLTRHKKNQLTLVRTDGFLAALTLAATQAISYDEKDLAIDARTRAVSALHNVCAPKDNRVLLMKHPGVLECFAHVLRTDNGEGRALATSSLALMAKTPSCRQGISRTEGLVDSLARILTDASEEFQLTPKETGDALAIFNINVEMKVSGNTGCGSREKHLPNSSASDESLCHSERHCQIEDSIQTVDSIRNQAEERKGEYMTEARANACATLLHLSKECSISHQLCTSSVLLDGLVFVANEIATPLSSKCLEIICWLTRFPPNNGILSRRSDVIETLLSACSSPEQDHRISALRSLQNMSSDRGSKSVLATSQVLTRMISCAMRKDLKEKEAAVAIVYNISTEPSAVAAITNTKNVVATLVHLAHSADSSSEVRLLACEALSTISLWLQTLAGTGKVPKGLPNVPLPSQKSSGWLRWD